MKIFYQILIIIFVCLSLFIIRDDVKTIYERVTSYLSRQVSLSPDSIKDTIVIQSEKVSNIFKSINTPGALRATGNVDLITTETKLNVKNIIYWTNKNRELNGNLPSLTEDPKLNFSAQIKLNDMFKQQYFEHISPDGVGVSNLGDQVSYGYIIIGENLALGNFKDEEALLRAWMESPGHRANILNSRYQDIGVAVGHGMFKGQDTWIAIQHFGLSRKACPSLDEVLRGVITINQKQIKTMGEDLVLRRKRIDSRVVYGGKTPNEQISEYNILVAQYNKLILDLKQKISTYNSGVRVFNTCISGSN